MSKLNSISEKRRTANFFSYVLLIVLSLIWIMPLLWVALTSFRAEPGAATPYFWPKGFTLKNYYNLFHPTSNMPYNFSLWFKNTLIVAIFSCLLATFYNLATAYVMSRLRFKMRKPFMNIALILGMFPGFMSMIAVYYILKAIGITQSLTALVLVYSSAAGLNFYIAKGFFDTIPKALDEAAWIDGATKFQVFKKLTVPLSKPIIVYSTLTAFLAPWLDFIFVSVIMGDNHKKYTVALGLFKMIDAKQINQYFTMFAAGSVLVSIPIALLFISMQKFYVSGVTGGSVKG